MSDVKKCNKKTFLSKSWVLFITSCFILTTAFMMLSKPVYAAGNLTVTSAKWNKKSIDTTLSKGSDDTSFRAVLNIKVKNTVAGSNKLLVTIQNTKTKAKMSAYAKANGGKITFIFSNTKKHTGPWKVTSVVAIKHSYKQGPWMNGYWTAYGTWNPGYYIKYDVNKKLKTIKVSKPAITVKCGAYTKLSMTSPTSIYASQGTIPLTATLQTDKGKAIANQTVYFQLVSNTSASVKPIVVSAQTNSKGIATVDAKVPKMVYDDNEFKDFFVSAYFKGTAKKYCASVSKQTLVKQPKEKTKFVMVPTWDGHTGRKTFTTKVVFADGPKKDTPVANIPVCWSLYSSHSKLVEHQGMAKTNAAGVSTISFDITNWQDYYIVLSGDYSTDAEIYQRPPVQRYDVKKQQYTVKYKIDWSKVQIQASGTATRVSWFSETASNDQRAFMSIVAENAIIDAATNQPLTGSGSHSPAFFYCKVEGMAPTVMTVDDNVYISMDLNKENTISSLSITANTAVKALRKIKLTMYLPEFERYSNGETRYVPLNAEVSNIFQ